MSRKCIPCKMFAVCSVCVDGILAVGIVDIDVYGLIFAFPFKNKAAFVCEHFVIFSFAERLELLTERAESPVKCKQFFICVEPVKTAATERILIALHGIFIAIIDTGDARERKL